ncbi:MAG: aminotransferase class V-fold PLP-dependent enzyme [Candidatus Aminicenantes bacterium]|nr:aminotransferase class V-fold PLP-dependent enzyme [Candidatus Aminicenantes bacterium]
MKRKDFLKGAGALVGGLAVSRKLPAADFGRMLQDGAGRGDEFFWDVIRDQFLLDPDWTYLNFGGLGSSPLPILNSLYEWLRVEERAPSAGYDAKEWASVKTKLATLLGPSCKPDDLGLISGATEGVNAIVNGLTLKTGDEVITSTHEHVAVNSALLNRMQRDGIVIKLFEPDKVRGLGNVDRIAALITPKTRLIIASHVTCTTGQRLPAKEISQLARAKGIWFALDGAQAPVCVPFDISDIGVDFYTCSTHKWLMGPKRTGFIYVRPGMIDAIRPLTVGGGSSKGYDIFKREFTLQPTAQRFEYGTQNDALFYAMGKACDFVQTIGLRRIFERAHGMAEAFYAGLRTIPGLEILSPEEEAYRTCMVGFRMKSKTMNEISEQLGKDKIRARPVGEGGLNSIRISFFLCNKPSDVDLALGSIKKLAG